MATEGQAQFITGVAAADLTGLAYRAVVLTTPVNGVPGVTTPGSAGVVLLGILAPQDDLTSGRAVRVCVAGPYKVEANGDFALGDPLSAAATTGRVDTASVGHFLLGRALAAAAAQGDIVPILVRPTDAVDTT
jgi:hypothetical protein